MTIKPYMYIAEGTITLEGFPSRFVKFFKSQFPNATEILDNDTVVLCYDAFEIEDNYNLKHLDYIKEENTKLRNKDFKLMPDKLIETIQEMNMKSRLTNVKILKLVRKVNHIYLKVKVTKITPKFKQVQKRKNKKRKR